MHTLPWHMVLAFMPPAHQLHLQVEEKVSPDVAPMRIMLMDTVGLEDSESGDAVNLQVGWNARRGRGCEIFWPCSLHW